MPRFADCLQKERKSWANAMLKVGEKKRHAWLAKCCKILANSWGVTSEVHIKQEKPIDRSFWKAPKHGLLIQKYLQHQTKNKNKYNMHIHAGKILL